MKRIPGLYIEPALVTWDGTSIPIWISDKGHNGVHLPYVDFEVQVNSFSTDEDQMVMVKDDGSSE